MNTVIKTFIYSTITRITEDIVEQREYIDNLEYGLHKIEFIKDLVIDASYDCTDFTKVLCNVD